MITILELAEFRLGHEARTAEDFKSAGLEMLGGCYACGATIAAYNACPTKHGSWACKDCVRDEGFPTVKAANDYIFPSPTLELLEQAFSQTPDALRCFAEFVEMMTERGTVVPDGTGSNLSDALKSFVQEWKP